MKHLRLYSPAFLGLCLFFSNWAAQTAVAQDPGAPGPRAVTREEYDFGDTAFQPTAFPGPVELLASVHSPTNLAGGPFPLVVFLHGRHATCYSGTTPFLEWPCAAGNSPIPSYKGYDYTASVLASHGYIVVSISANGINAVDNFTADGGMLARAELIQKHLDILRTFNTPGGAPFGTKFVGKINLTRVGTMGHSRGGEGVVRHFQLNAAQGSPYGIKAVFPLAATDFSRFVINNVALATLLPYCDGDVFDLQGVHFYDDARYNVPGDPSPKHNILVMGANHNFYNTIWTPGGWPAATSDDWTAIVGAFIPSANTDSQCGPGSPRRLTAAQQRGTGKAYMTAFFRTYVGGESQFKPLLTAATPAPPSATTNDLHVSYHAPDISTRRRDVNRLLNATNLTTNTLGGAVTRAGLVFPYDLCGGEEPQPRFCLERTPGVVAAFGLAANEPHTTPSLLNPAKRGLSQLRIGWALSGALYQNALPAGSRNVSGFQAVQFRASVNFEDDRNHPALPQDFSVVLTDGAGISSSVRVVAHSKALYYPPGDESSIAVPKVVLNTVRIPLTAFTGVNKTDIRSVRFDFNRPFLPPAGALLVSDLAFASAP